MRRLLTALALALPLSSQAQDVPTAALFQGAPMATLASGDLRVTVALPDVQHGFYRSTRFDWSGMITRVTLHGARFYGPWFDGVSPDVHDFSDTAKGIFVAPRNAATGPAEEFASRDGETVPGYNSTPAGGTFIKIGVGRLRKPDLQPYDHFAAYAIVDHGTWTVRRGKDRIAFIQHLAPDAGGYGYDYEKTITLTPDGGMTIAHRLRNIGNKPIHTQVYNHNLARFDDAPVGPGVRVQFPFAPAGPISAPQLATIEGDTVRYLAPLAPGDRVQLPVQPGDPAVALGAFHVTGANGAGITMQTQSPLVRSVLWSIRGAVAIEPFIQIDVAPGAEQRWSWHYIYNAEKKR